MKLVPYVKETFSATHNPTKLQTDILEAVRLGHNVRVQATAGGGKTTTAKYAMGVMAHDRPNATALGLVFNKRNSIEGGHAIAPLTSNGFMAEYSTYHALAFNTLKNGRFPFPRNRSGSAAVKVSGGKYHFMASDLVLNAHPMMKPQSAEHRTEVKWVKRLFEICQMRMITPDSADVEIEAIADYYAFPYKPEDAVMVKEMMRYGIEDATTAVDGGRALISFGDMPWLMYLFADKCPVQPYDFMVLDEAQDFNPLAEWIVTHYANQDTQFLIVGDEWQAIQGFAGAANDAMDSLGQMAQQVSSRKFEDLPLSESFRCPKSHVRMAAALGSPIQSFDWKDEGILQYIQDPDEIAKMVEVGDGVMFRYNKDAVRLALRLISQRKPAVVLGRTGRGIESMFKKFMRGTRRLNWSGVRRQIDIWEQKEINAARCDADEEEANETAEIGRALYDAFPASSLADFVRQVDKIFANESGDKRQVIELMTVHKSKGGEWRRTFLPNYDALLNIRGVRPWQVQQEQHVRFVGLTRAMEEMYIQYASDNPELEHAEFAKFLTDQQPKQLALAA